MLPFMVIVLSALIAIVSGLLAVTLFPDLTRAQAITWAVVTFGLVCIPSLAAIFARRPPEDDENNDK